MNAMTQTLQYDISINQAVEQYAFWIDDLSDVNLDESNVVSYADDHIVIGTAEQHYLLNDIAPDIIEQIKTAGFFIVCSMGMGLEQSTPLVYQFKL